MVDGGSWVAPHQGGGGVPQGEGKVSVRATTVALPLSDGEYENVLIIYQFFQGLQFF